MTAGGGKGVLHENVSIFDWYVYIASGNRCIPLFSPSLFLVLVDPDEARMREGLVVQTLYF